jgi:hypothetical protein
MRSARPVALVCMAALAGAACSSADIRSPMDGEWSAGDPQIQPCVQSWTFEGDLFDVSVYCALTDGQVGLEIRRGTFAVTGEKVTLTRTKSTCPDDTPEPQVLSFIVERNKLTLVSSTAVYTLARGGLSLKPGSTARFGCFDGQGGFTESMLRDLI